MNIAVVGGTFNPPHKGHKNIISCLSDLCEIDEVFVIPNNIPPHKTMPKNSPSPVQRLDMCRLMCENIKKTHVLDIEIKKDGASYTVDTIEDILKEYQNAKIYLAIGTDSFLNIELFKDYEKIIEKTVLCVFSRHMTDDNQSHKEYLERKLLAKVILMESDIIEISSTDIRQDFENGFIDDKIYNYIKKNKLYGV